MIPVDSNTRQALMARSITDKVEVVITPTFTGATPLVFEDKDIEPSSLSINKVCTDKKVIGIGTSALQQLDVQLRYNFGENNFKGSRVDVKYYLYVDDDYVLVTNHVFFIDQIEQTTPKITTILGYCNLKKLERAIGSRVFSGTPFEILAQINNALQDTIIQVPTDGSVPVEYQDLPNVYARLQLSREESGCTTYRDIVNALCQMMGVFVQTSPSHTYGTLRRYHLTSDLTIELGNRKAFSHNRYETSFTSLSVTGKAGTFVSPRGHSVGGGTYVIDDSPCWDYGTVTGLQSRTDNLKNWMVQYSYMPATLTLWSDPTIECGDRISVICDDGTYDILVTEVQWNYRSSTTIKSAGEDTKDSAKTGSKVDRKYAVDNNANKLVMYSVTNATEVSLGVEDDPECLCRISFSTMGDTEIIWLGEALIQALADAITVPVTINVVDQQGNPVTVLDSNGNPVVFSGSNSHAGSVTIQVIYKLDGADRDYSPKDEYLAGNHILSMFHTVMVEEQSSHSWEVWLKVLQGNVKIGEYKFNGTLMGQNLIATETWGGILTLFDDIGRVISACATQSLNDTLGRQVGEDWEEVIIYDEGGDENHKLHKRTLSDDIQDTTSAVTVKNPTESVTITLLYHDAVCFCGENYYAGTDGVLL